MGLNATPSAERVHIGFFGLRNAGKSSLVNAVTGQQLSLVSDIKGTTTDPVQKAMELLPLGPVVIIDTPGFDDFGTLGEMRVERTKQILDKTDIAVLVSDATLGLQKTDYELTELFKAHKIPFITVFNKCDLLKDVPENDTNVIYASTADGTGITALKEMLGGLCKKSENEQRLIGDLINRNDIVLLVTPIDEAAPKGRIILPQQQVIRDVLDSGGINIVVKDTELPVALSALKQRPKMVVTDSQAFGLVSKTVPEDILLTSFSILFARYKGELETVIKGAAALDSLNDGDTLLISEGCTHHRQCGDIGTQKLPNWILKYTEKHLNFEFTSGGEFPEELSKYSLIVHCGGCTLNAKEMQARQGKAKAAAVPITNYGIAIAQMHGILKRSLSPFPQISALL